MEVTTLTDTLAPPDTHSPNAMFKSKSEVGISKVKCPTSELSAFQLVTPQGGAISWSANYGKIINKSNVHLVPKLVYVICYPKLLNYLMSNIMILTSSSSFQIPVFLYST